MWYVADESGRQAGPFSTEDIIDGLSRRKLTPYMRIWREGNAAWQLIGDEPTFAHRVQSVGEIPPPLPPVTHPAKKTARSVVQWVVSVAGIFFLMALASAGVKALMPENAEPSIYANAATGRSTIIGPAWTTEIADYQAGGGPGLVARFFAEGTGVTVTIDNMFEDWASYKYAIVQYLLTSPLGPTQWNGWQDISVNGVNGVHMTGRAQTKALDVHVYLFVTNNRAWRMTFIHEQDKPAMPNEEMELVQSLVQTF